MLDPATAKLIGGLRLATDWPVWLVAVAAVVLGVFVLVLYLREMRGVAAPWSWLLPGIRSTAVVLALLLLAAPVWHRRQVIGTPSTVVWAVDRSLSMGERDSQSAGDEWDEWDEWGESRVANSPRNRLRRAVDRLWGEADQAGWIDDLKSTHLMDVVAFDEVARRVWSSESLDEVGGDFTGDQPETEEADAGAGWLEVADGLRTNLSAPLQAVADQAARDGTSASEGADGPSDDAGSNRVLVLMSDGRDSVGEADAAGLADQLAKVGWQVHAVGFGSLDETPDVGVVDVDAPERVADDGRLAGQVWLKHFGVGQQTLRVQIRGGDAVVWEDVVTIEADGKTAVPFDFAVETLMEAIRSGDLRGVDRDSVVLSLTAEVAVVPANDSGSDSIPAIDLKPANDHFDFRVAAASRDRRLLILDGSSRWETRYLRNLFSRDPAWQVDAILFGAGTDELMVERGEMPGQLPDSSRSWGRYDAVILGEIPPYQWTAEDARHLSEFVSRGGGLIVVDGRYQRIGTWIGMNAGGIESEEDAGQTNLGGQVAARTAMAQLIPVRVMEPGEGLTESVGSTKYQLEPTDAGRSHPVLLLESNEVSGLWGQMPGPRFMVPVRASEDAEVWVQAIDDSKQKSPWLVTRLFGSGRVFYLASDQTWRWRYKVEGRLHRRFWNQLLTAAMQPPYAVSDEFVSIGTDKIDYELGQPVTIRARIKPDQGMNPSSFDLETETAVQGVQAVGSQTVGVQHVGEHLLGTTVDAILLQDDQVVATIPMQLDNAQRQTYVAQSEPLAVGKYDVRVRASGYDATALKASSPIWVTAPRSTELDRLSVDEPSLQRIAQAGGGVYVHESSADELVELLKPLSRGRIVETDTALMQSWWVFLAIMGLLSLEWYFRKKAGLA
ncbi:VWA domain-containing protein [Neorhodopirellula lusitana]|uniref:VWA domain-containing protein n=1 Tax=Neorhodopirellula lusitana TaxID=445327 RepID=UPI00384D6BAE